MTDIVPVLLVLAVGWVIWSAITGGHKRSERTEPMVASVDVDDDIQLDSPLRAVPVKAAPSLVIERDVASQPRLRGATRESQLPKGIDYSGYEAPTWQRRGVDVQGLIMDCSPTGE